tara:strand:+ start:897 stop:1436 length:540 start_codon:yes stop_codon:yes gene_type:complete
MDRWISFAETAFDAMEAVVAKGRWENAKTAAKKVSLTRLFYDQIHSCGLPNQLPYISLEAMRLPKNKKPTKDHILSPQFVSRMIYDNPNVWLSDYKIFESLFFRCCQTIQVSKSENEILKGFTSNRDDNFLISVPTIDKYEAAGINLYDQSRSTFVKNNIFENLVPEELTEYEKPYLIT